MIIYVDWVMILCHLFNVDNVPVIYCLGNISLKIFTWLS